MLSADEREKKTRTCIMPVCAGERFDLVHRFPREDDRTQLWLKSIDLPHLFTVPPSKLRTSYFICSRHFRKKDYKNVASRHLNKTAFPCINLKSLDQIDEAIDRSVRRTEETNYPIDINSENLDRNLDNEDVGEISSPIENHKRSNQGKRERDICLEEVNVEIFPKTRRKKEIEDGVERFVINLTDHPKSSEHSSEIEVLSEYRLDIHKCKSIENLFQQSEEPEEDLEEIEGIIDKQNADEVLQEPATHEEASEMVADQLVINHPKYLDGLKLNCIWLRDHCRCVDCYNFETRQRKMNILDIGLDVKPVAMDVRENTVFVEWNDGHESQYDIDLLFNCQLTVESLKDDCKHILWDEDTIHQLDYSRVNFNNYLTDDSVAKSVVKSLIEFGFAFIEKVPPNSSMTEAAIRRLFPIQKTFFGEMWTFMDEKLHSDTAYSNEYLGSHTDNTYWNDAAGLQILHCVKHTGSGGETILTDGFKVVFDLELKDPKAFNHLSTVNLPSEYIENGVHYSHTGPIIRLDPTNNRPEQIRYNIYDRALFNTLPQSEMSKFYKSLHSLAVEVNREENQWRFKLNPGTVLIFDNWRILHGREKYTGKRQITGCYVARCEFLNAARVMGLIS